MDGRILLKHPSLFGLPDHSSHENFVWRPTTIANHY
jgi:hypothetical protein